MAIGYNIRRLRLERGLTQLELAKAVGVTEPMICMIERGTKSASMPLGQEIARVLGCDLNDLIADNPQTNETASPVCEGSN